MREIRDCDFPTKAHIGSMADGSQLFEYSCYDCCAHAAVTTNGDFYKGEVSLKTDGGSIKAYLLASAVANTELLIVTKITQMHSRSYEFTSPISEQLNGVEECTECEKALCAAEQIVRVLKRQIDSCRVGQYLFARIDRILLESREMLYQARLLHAAERRKAEERDNSSLEIVSIELQKRNDPLWGNISVELQEAGKKEEEQ